MFTHLEIDFPELESRSIDGVRYYPTPSGSLYPSITSVTSHYNRQVFKEWRERVGDEEANRITKESTTRGTNFHQICEDYLTNKLKEPDCYDPQAYYMFVAAKPYIDKVGNIHAIEKSLYSDVLGIAGRVDCIAEYDGELAVIDFKTSKSIKPEAWIQQYFVQEVAYACMYYELTNTKVKKLITIMVTPDGEVKVFDKRNKGYYIDLLIQYIKQFVHDKLESNGNTN
ncbi:MAG: exonuclease [Candidatus Nanopelagicales bacterium]|nr:exonuclease [Synechococcus phage DSL-LC03]